MIQVIQALSFLGTWIASLIIILTVRFLYTNFKYRKVIPLKAKSFPNNFLYVCVGADSKPVFSSLMKLRTLSASFFYAALRDINATVDTD